MFQFLKQQVKNYFGFGNSESKGFMLLLVILSFFLLLPFILDYFSNTEKSEATSIEKFKMDSITANIEIINKEKQNKFEEKYADNDFKNYNHFENYASKKTEIRYFNFDPNTIKGADWESLGLPKFMAERIIKYTNAGGKFRKKEDLQKIYGLLPATYKKLEPFIQIENSTNIAPSEKLALINTNIPVAATPTINNNEKYVTKKPINFNLNTADTTDLMRIKGIGTKLSQRILKYRDMLGGFHSKNQVKEVFGLDSNVVEEILKYGGIKNGEIHKININETKEIKHPYIKPYVAKAILAYREQHGKFNNIEDMKPIKILDANTLERIKPYLSFQ